MPQMSKLKFTLFLAITATLFLTSCRVTKQISKQDTQIESASKVDSSGVKRNDITKETKAISETTEIIDTTVFVNTKGDIVTDTAQAKGKEIPIRIHKKKVTKSNVDIKETDKSESKVEVKKKQETKSENTMVQKDIKKTGFAWYWWILIVLAILIAVAWRYRKFLGL